MKIEDSTHVEKISWLLKAISKDPKMPHLHATYFDSEKKQLVATDGHRLHVLKNIDWDCLQNIKTGSIEFAKSGKSYLFTEVCYGPFPNYQRIIPEDCQKYAHVFAIGKNNWSEISSNYFKVLKGLNAPLNFKYFKDVLSCVDAEFNVSINGNSDGGPIKFESESLLAVLMPMRQ